MGQHQRSQRSKKKRSLVEWGSFAFVVAGLCQRSRKSKAKLQKTDPPKQRMIQPHAVCHLSQNDFTSLRKEDPQPTAKYASRESLFHSVLVL